MHVHSFMGNRVQRLNFHHSLLFFSAFGLTLPFCFVFLFCFIGFGCVFFFPFGSEGTSKKHTEKII